MPREQGAVFTENGEGAARVSTSAVSSAGPISGPAVPRKEGERSEWSECPSPESREEALRLWTVLARSYQTVSRTVSERVAEYGVTLPQFEILEALHRRGPRSLGQLADELLVTGGNITYVMDRLEDRDLVFRQRCPEDRRVVKARLTSEGRELIASVLPRHSAFVLDQLGHLDSGERRELGRLLRKLKRSSAEAVERSG